MVARGTTIREAAELWVNEMNKIPTEMLYDIAGWEEVTLPTIGKSVWVRNECDLGEVIDVKDPDEDGAVWYEVELHGGKTVCCEKYNLAIQTDSDVPVWGTMWSFSDIVDNYWIEEKGGLSVLSDCGFRVFYHDSYGYYFGVDSGGHDFFDRYWIPLYKARGMKWHDPATESGSFVMRESRRSDLLPHVAEALYGYIGNVEETREALKNAGFCENELEFLGYGLS